MCNRNCCKLCPNLVISSTVTAGTSLVVNVPAIHEKFCLVVAQNIPDTATINLPVSITIGAGTTEYSVVDCNGVQVTASMLKTRTRYPIVVFSNGTNVTFRIMRKLSCAAVVPFGISSEVTGE